jgi:hypothetical protein
MVVRTGFTVHTDFQHVIMQKRSRKRNQVNELEPFCTIILYVSTERTQEHTTKVRPELDKYKDKKKTKRKIRQDNTLPRQKLDNTS